MGFFRKFQKKKNGKESKSKDAEEEQQQHNKDVAASSNSRRSYLRQKSMTKSMDKATMENVPSLIEDLQSVSDTSDEKTLKVLRKLFALSEHQKTRSQDNRTQLVHVHQRLVPALLQLLINCPRGSSEQYLTLLVLNNLSIPDENKHAIALEHGGAKILSRVLCEDPSCHIVAIVLVNLTFSAASLRKDLVDSKSDIQIVEALCFALRVASLSQEEFEHLQPVIEGDLENGLSPAEKMYQLASEDRRLLNPHVRVVNPKFQLFSETARWCLTAIKNLTRPCEDPTACLGLVKTGVLPLILRFVTISDIMYDDAPMGSTSSQETPMPAEPTTSDVEPFNNVPSVWDGNSIQDAALFVVLNLAACVETRHFLDEAGALHVLSSITDYTMLKHDDESMELSDDERKHQEFQCIKARMSLAYLVGSDGHFGQTRLSNTASTVYSSPEDSALILADSEIIYLVRLLADVMHGRGRSGAGGYSSTTFATKYIVYAIRCLLTHSLNQMRFSQLVGLKLNSLLMKVLGRYSVQDDPTLDRYAAEHACFSLYLQSSYGFAAPDPFLPLMFNSPDCDASLTAKVLSAYLRSPTITPPGRHATEQLLLRLRYLKFGKRMKEIATPDDSPTVEDLTFENQLLSESEKVFPEKHSTGAKPRDDIFDRPILRSRAPVASEDSRAPWSDRTTISVFPTVLHAVQQLSFGSNKVRHSNAIDDILIANNIASSANGEKTESYNYWWSWEDTANQIQRSLDKKSSRREAPSRLSFFGKSQNSLSDPGKPVSLFVCGGVCTGD